ncbi:MAG: hypothetical protein KC438_03445 [Thermomicrobiales bacterium]|nr:hypothetical protein [Thermomicrobiales bacterium]
MDNAVYVQVDNQAAGGENEPRCPQGLGMVGAVDRAVLHVWGEMSRFIHIPGFGKVA